MRNAKVISVINNSPKVQVDNIGEMSLYCFAQKLYNAGKIDYKTLRSTLKTAFTSEYATKLLNENINLFPVIF